jgi:hypothetical protein
MKHPMAKMTHPVLISYSACISRAKQEKSQNLEIIQREVSMYMYIYIYIYT